MDITSAARALAFPLRTIPAILLVVFAGVLGLIALVCRSDRRAYAMELTHVWITAACVIATGQKATMGRRKNRAG